MSLTRRDFARQSAITVGRGRADRQRRRTRHRARTPSRPRRRTRPGNGDGHGTGTTESATARSLPDPKGLLALPAGFSYRVITHSGKTKLDSGEITPSNHDGTAAFAGPRGTTLLVNNHELKGPRANWKYPVPLTEGLVYDPAASGGCTVVEVRPGGQVAEWVGIAGTSTNCAGGSTPWGTWLTCEENCRPRRRERHDQGPRLRLRGRPLRQARQPRTPSPLKVFGRYDHEAVVIDPRRGHAYLTEDAATAPTASSTAGPRRSTSTTATAAFRTLSDDRGHPPGAQVLRLRGPVRRRPLPRHEDRHGVRRRLGRRTRPRRPDRRRAQAVR